MLFLVADNLADYYQTEQYNYIEQNTIVVIETAIILPIEPFAKAYSES